MHEHRGWCFFAFIGIGVAAIAVLFFADSSFTAEYQAMQSVSETKSKQETLNVFIQIELGTERRAFEGRAKNNLTLQGALEEISKTAGLAMIMNSSGIGAIGDIENKEKEWRVYKNDKPLPAPLSYVLRGGDMITLRYE